VSKPETDLDLNSGEPWSEIAIADLRASVEFGALPRETA
jgi:hypothetical protein